MSNHVTLVTSKLCRDFIRNI